MSNPVKRMAARCTRRPGYLMLVASDADLAACEPRDLSGVCWQVWALSAAWGIAQAWLWALAWRVFGDYSGLPLMPVALIVALTFSWIYRRAAISLADSMVGRQERHLAITVLVAAWVLILLGLQGWHPDWAVSYPSWIRWARPMAVFRPLILAPLWGAWGMMITCLFSRPSFTMQPAVSAYAGRCGPIFVAAAMAVNLGLSLWYFNYLPWSQAAIPCATAVVALISGLALSRGGRRLTRKVLLANNLVAQLAFLTAYVAVRH